MGYDTRYWRIDVQQGDLIQVDTNEGVAILEVQETVGNRIVYNCVVSNDAYYGTTKDDHLLHKRLLTEDNFYHEKTLGD